MANVCLVAWKFAYAIFAAYILFTKWFCIVRGSVIGISFLYKKKSPLTRAKLCRYDDRNRGIGMSLTERGLLGASMCSLVLLSAPPMFFIR